MSNRQRALSRLTLFAIITLAAVACSGPERPAASPTPQAPGANVGATAPQATQPPGQYDILEGTAIQIRAQASENGRGVAGYRWDIVEGAGGTVLDADTATATFVARQVPNPVESFLLRLTTRYQDGRTSAANMIVRVHRNAPTQSSPSPARERYGYDPWFYGALGFGFGYVWHYPVYVPIIVPPPDEIWLPDELPPVSPEPLPPEQIGELPEDLQPPVTLPEDIDFPDPVTLPADEMADPVQPDDLDGVGPLDADRGASDLEQDSLPGTDITETAPGSDWGFQNQDESDIGGDFGGDFEGDFDGDF